MRILHLVFPLAIYCTAYSSPVPPNAMRSRAEPPLLLALLLTFVSLLFILFFTKWLYIMRCRQAKRVARSRTTLRSGWCDNFSNSSLRFGKLFMGSGSVKSGFLIGLLGSPSWETRYSALLFDRCSLFPESSFSSRKSVSGLSPSSPCSSRSFSCSSRVQEEHTHAVPISIPSPAVTINSSLTNLCIKGLGRLWIPKRSSSVTIPAIGTAFRHPSIQDESNLAANNIPSVSGIVAASPASKTINDTSFDVFFPARLSSRDQKPLGLESLPMSSPLPSVVQSFETSFDKHSFKSVQSRSVETASKNFAPSKAIHPKKYFLSVSSYRRSYQSPKIGPSPLRTMTLPTERNRHNHCLSLPPVHVGIYMDPKENLVLDGAKNAESLSTQTPCSKKGTDVDSLLDLMAELAQETSAWDPNVFMDQNFRNLIAQSKPQANLKETTVRPGRRSWRLSRYRKVQHVFTTLEDIPEVDGDLPVTEMMPASSGDAYIHSFWSEEEDGRQINGH